MVSDMCCFCSFAQVALKTCTNIRATVPLEIMNGSNKLPEMHSCSQTPAKEKYFYIISLSFR
jgi:hypothetical protein